MNSVWPTIERFIAEHGAAVLVTLADTRGSSPREAGARMVVRPDGGFTGTIGGGALEWMALADAQALLAHKDAAPMRRFDRALGPDLGQCCGGRVGVRLERFDAGDCERIAELAAAERNGPITTVATIENGRRVRRLLAEGEAVPVPSGQLREEPAVEHFGTDNTALYLFGAGHVGRALVMALAPLPFTIAWVDARPGAFPPHIPANVTCRTEPDPVPLLGGAPDGAFVAIMTHSHALDLELTTAALTSGRFAYVGLIGSATKRNRFVSQMRKLGIAEDTIGRLICPIGLTEIRDKAPASIAAAVAAQLLIVRATASQTASGDTRGTSDLVGNRHA
jgi:xanthine dehydrogenase accessory factor